MKVLHIVENLDESYGGPAKSVPFLVSHLNKLGIQNVIFAAKIHDQEQNYLVDDYKLDVRKFSTFGVRKARFCPDLIASLENEVTADSIIHIHTLWTYPAYAAFQVAKSSGVPLVVSTRGMLYEWSMKQNKLVKKFAMWCFQKALLRRANIIHITESGEEAAVRRLGINTVPTLVPNGIDLNEFASLKDQTEAKADLGLQSDKNYILFMSRIHPKKGLIHLIEAWSSLSKQYTDWDLLIVGPVDDEAYLNEILGVLGNKGLRDKVVLTGMLHGTKRLDAFAASRLFVLPSYTENFGIVICEALAAGLPVITTNGTPWKEIKDKSIGWWVGPNSQDIKKSLIEALDLSPEDLKQRGQGGISIAKKFRWADQSKKMFEAYSKISRANQY
tara:strand:+ start:981 stop:2141 length:1161 start_codon:yes stop_codon:yes gene_type:complete